MTTERLPGDRAPYALWAAVCNACGLIVAASDKLHQVRGASCPYCPRAPGATPVRYLRAK